MASALPVAAYDADGVRDLVRAGETGLLARAGDVEELIHHLRQLVGDAALRAELGARAQITARAHTWEMVMDDLLTTYAKVISTYAAGWAA